MNVYQAAENRYSGQMPYRRCGQSGLLLPAISLGLWHNFGSVDSYENGRAMVRRAFDLGITHFDLANNYGPIPGSAEENFGRMLATDLKPYRDELVIATKAGYDMWPGPYGDLGSRKYLIASLDQSLKRLGLGYVDIFYHHRPDPDTPLEESMGALAQIVRSGKALYAAVSNYPAARAGEAIAILRSLGTPRLIHQAKYSLLDRRVEDKTSGAGSLLDVVEQQGIGLIVFSPLAQGLLTNKYLNGIPKDSRAAKITGALPASAITEAKVRKIKDLNQVASRREQTLAQLAIAWLLQKRPVTSVLIGASKVSQLDDCVAALKSVELSTEELNAVETILNRPE